MRKIYSTTVIGQAEMLQVVLRSHGIESRLENEGGALYAVGMPTAAVPISIVVDDERADEAARIVAEEFTKTRTPEPTAVMVQMPCACGKTLEFPRGEEPPAVCPWCNRPTQAATDPDSPPAAAPVSRPIIGAFVVVGLILLGVLFIGGFYGFRKAREQIRRAEAAMLSGGESHAQLVLRLRKAIAEIPTPPMAAINPDAVAAEMTKELPEAASRFTAALDSCATLGDLVDRWLRFTADLSPDWAVDTGLVETQRPGRYSTRVMKSLLLLNTLTLRKLRSMAAEAATFDGRLFERYLERALLRHVLFGTELTDPRAALWGIQASYRHKDQPDVLAARLEELPEVIADVQRELRNVTGPILELSLQELNESMEMLRDLEQNSGVPRVVAAVGKARDALADFATHLRRMQQNPAPMAGGDPRWILYLIREGEFSTRTARDAATLLLDESERALPKWNGQAASIQPVTSPYTKEQWKSEVGRFLVHARDLTLERNFVEVPAGDLPEVIDSPLQSRGNPDEPAYGSRALQPKLKAFLWVTGWDTTQSPTASLSAATAQVCTMAETYPGRHVHELLARRDGSIVRRLYESTALAEGWRAHCHRWAAQTLPHAGYDAVYADGIRFSQGWAAAVEICYLAGTLSEDEAADLIARATSETEEQARVRLASALVEPLTTAGAVLGELDLIALRDEVQAKLGPKFDLKKFHTRLLGYGRAPLALIREEMLRDAR